jgi:hypothetical protein
MNLTLPIFAVLLRVFSTRNLVESVLQKKLVAQLVRKFAALREVCSFITVFTRAFYWVLHPERLFTPVGLFRFKNYYPPIYV